MFYVYYDLCFHNYCTTIIIINNGVNALPTGRRKTIILLKFKVYNILNDYYETQISNKNL